MIQFNSAKKKVLFLCTHNSARSQIAEALLKYFAGSSFEVESAGTSPCGVNTYAVKVLAEIGIEVLGQYSKSLSQFANEKFDYVITVCANAEKFCPVFAGSYKKIHWPLDDPAGVKGSRDAIKEAFRKTLKELKELVIDFINNQQQK